MENGRTEAESEREIRPSEKKETCASANAAEELCVTKETEDSQNGMANWMSSLLPDSCLDLPITELAIPGSHNSGAFVCEMGAGLAPDADSPMRRIVSIPGLGGLVQAVVQKWCVCQNLTFKQQLEAGIRYFDLRVSTKPGCDDLYFVHAMYCAKMENLIEDVKSFLATHDKEVILLDFNHFHAMEEEQHILLLTRLISEFDSKLQDVCELSELSLRKLRQAGKQVVMFYHHDSGQLFESVWPSSAIAAPWPNTADADICIQCLDTFHSRPRRNSVFHVTQGILTPKFDVIMKDVFKGSLQNLNRTLTPKLEKWIAESQKSCESKPNIVMGDFVNEGDFMTQVLRLNGVIVGWQL